MSDETRDDTGVGTIGSARGANADLPERATVDRFEEALAVLNVDGQERIVERCRLPADAREGDVIDFVRGRVDVEATREARERLTSLRASLPIKGGDFSL